mmetsp:Transcript_48056/g.76979  ORF Transcript_48056/g.76979 Transcript_48056/m.76979 type:complete len:417 (-) Transcript_48056:501-1751(-)|eukprot:CAMPEP_0197049692 /NCGR_PEP_ID=MMETSP1384-20130603/24773_1 /TAXON_ID=29189 /ORGANISM="Ammonia sp." /LENGTH=416 /DNA_ID=CAMNT_0042482009 /DNA_START=63 /DNA_END=1313 /DNA_ORIENTATION=+
MQSLCLLSQSQTSIKQLHEIQSVLSNQSFPLSSLIVPNSPLSASSAQSPPDDVEEEDIDEIDFFELLTRMEATDQDIDFSSNGYEKLGKIADCLQGELWRARAMKSDCLVAIKQISKKLSEEKIAEIDGMSFCVNTNVVQEAMILQRIHGAAHPCNQHVVKMVDFFESRSHFYLVMELIDGVTLTQFTASAHTLMCRNQLSLKEYSKAIKHILWQLVSTMHALHTVHHCCHLALRPENIMLLHANFVERADGSYAVDDRVSLKVIDFGVAELFTASEEKESISYRCRKHELSVDDNLYAAPQIIDGDSYDARQADLWSIGMIYLQCMVRQPVFCAEQTLWSDEPDDYLSYICSNQLKQYLIQKNLFRYFSSEKSFDFLNGLLQSQESKRMTSQQAVKHIWFSKYSKKCKSSHHDSN